MQINELSKEAYEISASKGFHEQKHDPAVRLMLIVSELSECLEEIRKGKSMTDVYYEPGNPKPEGVPVEIADCFIRLGDFCEEYGIDAEWAIRLKMDYNKTREHKHGRVF